jgi:hypothetical protein
MAINITKEIIKNSVKLNSKQRAKVLTEFDSCKTEAEKVALRRRNGFFAVTNMKTK